MKPPEWIKPAVYGAVTGALALAIFGFTAGGILAIMYLRPQWLGLGMPEVAPSSTTPPTQATTPRKP